MAKKTYTVAGPFSVLEHKPGETFSAELPPEQEKLLLENGSLELGATDASEQKDEKVACPACVEQELARPPKFDDLGALQKHYVDRHAGLAVPETLPEPEPEKEA